MSPWEELRWFNSPVLTVVPVTVAPATQIVATNPQRVVLALSLPANSTAVTISTAAKPQVGQGIALVNGTLPLIFTAKDHPWLCQSAWFAIAATSQAVCVVEVILREWPLTREQMAQYRQRMPDSAIQRMLGDATTQG